MPSNKKDEETETLLDLYLNVGYFQIACDEHIRECVLQLTISEGVH